MIIKELIKEEIQNSILTKQRTMTDDSLIAKIEILAKKCVKVLKNSGKIIFCGNGGSFADAQHLTAEFVSRLRFDRAPLPSIALGTNNSNLTAIANDYGYEKVFRRELESIASVNDLLIPISTSGNSTNVIEAIDFAIEKGIDVFGLTGRNGGKMGQICNQINVPSEETERIQEVHIMIGHIVCFLVEKSLFKIEN
jgi:D-sedoheptulose 7-phosphate isomerase